MMNLKHTKRRIRSWLRSPQYYLRKGKERVFGVNATFLDNPRERYAAGTAEWLAITESMYGGLQVGGVVTKANRGGDRMSPLYHAYGRSYAEFLRPFLQKSPERLTLAEVGILNGNGLAIWCDLFPTARVIGFDINIANFQGNKPQLEALGAFSRNTPEVHEFDQLDHGKAITTLRRVLSETKLDVVIDDGCHSIESIEITFRALHAFLAKDFVYFIEDNFDSYDHLAHKYPDYRWTSHGELTIVTSR